MKINFSRVTDEQLWELHLAALYRTSDPGICGCPLCGKYIQAQLGACRYVCPAGNATALCSFYDGGFLKAVRIMRLVESEMRRRDKAVTHE